MPYISLFGYCQIFINNMHMHSDSSNVEPSGMWNKHQGPFFFFFLLVECGALDLNRIVVLSFN